jgi:beta-alanine degradation protein BauB
MTSEMIDPVQVSPAHYAVLMENDVVRVLDMTLPAGVSDEMHSHPNETVYFLTGGKVRVHLPGGETAELEPPDGFVMWHEAWTHRVENIGSTDIHAIVVESKV